MALRPALLVIPLLVATSASAQPSVTAPPAAAEAGAPAPAAPEAPALRTAAPLEPQGRIGFGVGIGTADGLPSLYVPIDIEGVRTEIELGYEGSPTEDDGDSALRTGIGLFGLAPGPGAIRGYGGVRFRYVRAEDAGATAQLFRLGAAFGGEWVPVPAVAVGVEAQLGYSWFSEPEDAPSRVDLKAQAFLRVFTTFSRSGAPARAVAPAASGAPGAAPAPAPARPPSRLVRCQTSDDCERGICYEGYCRR